MGFYLGSYTLVHPEEDESVAGSTLLTAAGVVTTAVAAMLRSTSEFCLCSFRWAGMVIAGSSVAAGTVHLTSGFCCC